MPASSAAIPGPGSMSDAEWQLRTDLAACYQLAAHFGWDDLIYTHISARVPGSDHHFLINPYGMMFEEITASSLIKIEFDGRKVDDTPWPVNEAGFIIHSAVHMGRESAGCVMHLHTMDGVAVSAMDEGLMPINQMAIVASGNAAYHEYEGPAFRPDERERLLASLGEKPTMILRNHGTLAVGPSIPEAFLAMYMLERACTTQVRSLAGGGKLHPVEPEASEFTRQVAISHADPAHAKNMVWPAMLRLLDRKGSTYKE